MSNVATTIERETRVMPIDGMEIRAADDGPDYIRKFSGYAAVFGQITDIGGFREQVAQGAFRKTLREARNVAFLWNHDENTVMASTQSGTLRLKEDRTGLHVEADLDLRDDDARQLVTKMERGDVQHMSFAFSVVKDEWDEAASPPLRTLREVKLYDASAVLFPAYPQTTAEVRSRLAALGIDPEATPAQEDSASDEVALDVTDRGADATEEVAQIDPADILRDADPEQLRAMFDALQALMATADQAEDEPEGVTPEHDGADEPTPDHSPSRSLSPDLARRQIALRRRRKG